MKQKEQSKVMKLLGLLRPIEV